MTACDSDSIAYDAQAGGAFTECRPSRGRRAVAARLRCGAHPREIPPICRSARQPFGARLCRCACVPTVGRALFRSPDYLRLCARSEVIRLHHSNAAVQNTNRRLYPIFSHRPNDRSPFSSRAGRIRKPSPMGGANAAKATGGNGNTDREQVWVRSYMTTCE